MLSKNLKWTAVFLTVIAICVGIIIFMNVKSDSVVAEVYVDGKLQQTIVDLDTDKEKSFTISNSYGTNVVCYCKGEIWIGSSDCANQTCVNFGKASIVGQNIICVPHRLVIKLTGNADKEIDLTV